MIEKVLIAYLNNVMSVPVYAEKPDNPPEKYIVLQLIDGGIINKVNAATIGFNSYADTLMNASDLNEELQDALFNIIILDEISSATLGGTSRNIDTNTKAYCYESIFNFYYYK